MIDGVVILLQVRADECWNPARSGRARMAIQARRRGRFKVWLQAIAFQEPGQWDCRSV
jgi:hypothetical protein